jgi:hypothetical protein
MLQTLAELANRLFCPGGHVLPGLFTGAETRQVLAIVLIDKIETAPRITLIE